MTGSSPRCTSMNLAAFDGFSASSGSLATRSRGSVSTATRTRLRSPTHESNAKGAVESFIFGESDLRSSGRLLACFAAFAESGEEVSHFLKFGWFLFGEVGLFGEILREIEERRPFLRRCSRFWGHIFSASVRHAVWGRIFDVLPLAGLDGEWALYASIVGYEVRTGRLRG